MPTAAKKAGTEKKDEAPAEGAQAASEDVKTTHAEDITRIERYLTNIRTITSDFAQLAPDGSTSSGKMLIKRPNKMRWTYDPPTPILMVTRGNFLTYYDFELKQVSDIPLDDTLLSFFASDQIKFGESVKVLSLEKTPGLLRIRIQQAANPELGTLTMEFTDQPLTLRNFLIKDAQGKVTNVALTNTRFDEPLEDDLFEFQDPRVRGKARKRSGTERN